MLKDLGQHRWKALAIAGLACIAVSSAFQLELFKVSIDHLLAEVGALLLVVGILHWFFELSLRKETIREVAETITGSTALHDVGMVDASMNSRSVRDVDEWRRSSRLIVGIQYSPRFFKDFYNVIRDRSQAGLRTQAVLLQADTAAERYLRETGTGNPQVTERVSEIRELLEEADAGRGLTSVQLHDRVLRYSFIQTENFVWIKFFTNSSGRTEVPAFKVRAGSPLYEFVSRDIERLVGEPDA